MGYPVPLTTEDWARIRYEYESTTRKVVEICAEHGISDGTLRDRVRRWGWKRRSAGRVAREGPPPKVVIEVNGVVAQQGVHRRRPRTGVAPHGAADPHHGADVPTTQRYLVAGRRLRRLVRGQAGSLELWCVPAPGDPAARR